MEQLMPYEVRLGNAVANWTIKKGHTNKGRFYQLNPERIFFPVRNNFAETDVVRNIESLIREPHKLTSSYCSRNGIYLQCSFVFELTKTDRENDAREIKDRTMMYRRNSINLDHRYAENIQDLLLEDVELKKKYMEEQKKQTVKNFLKETIGPEKSKVYAPPGVYGEKGGLLYRSAAKKTAAAATMKQGGKRKIKRKTRKHLRV